MSPTLLLILTACLAVAVSSPLGLPKGMEAVDEVGDVDADSDVLDVVHHNIAKREAGGRFSKIVDYDKYLLG
jgi:hypothetical protein